MQCSLIYIYHYHSKTFSAFVFGIDVIFMQILRKISNTGITESQDTTEEKVFVLLILEVYYRYSITHYDQRLSLYTQAMLVPLQGFMNAVVYAWTSWDFFSAMSSRHTSNYYSSSKSDWQEEGSVEGTEENEEQETDVEEDEEYLMHCQHSIMSLK